MQGVWNRIIVRRGKESQQIGQQDESSPTTSDMQQQLEHYTRALQLPQAKLQTALQHLADIDFSSARAHLVTSVPGKHAGAVPINELLFKSM